MDTVGGILINILAQVLIHTDIMDLTKMAMDRILNYRYPRRRSTALDATTRKNKPCVNLTLRAATDTCLAVNTDRATKLLSWALVIMELWCAAGLLHKEADLTVLPTDYPRHRERHIGRLEVVKSLKSIIKSWTEWSTSISMATNWATRKTMEPTAMLIWSTMDLVENTSQLTSKSLEKCGTLSRVEVSLLAPTLIVKLETMSTKMSTILVSRTRILRPTKMHWN